MKSRTVLHAVHEAVGSHVQVWMGSGIVTDWGYRTQRGHDVNTNGPIVLKPKALRLLASDFRNTVRRWCSTPSFEAANNRMIDQQEKFGTVFLVEKQWYVRLEGFGGILFPLHTSVADVNLKDGVTAKLVGRLSHDHRGFPTSMQATAIEQIGSK